MYVQPYENCVHALVRSNVHFMVLQPCEFVGAIHSLHSCLHVQHATSRPHNAASTQRIASSFRRAAL
jgi:hypothetical protein